MSQDPDSCGCTAAGRGVRFPDQTFMSDVDARDFPAKAIEQAGE